LVEKGQVVIAKPASMLILSLVTGAFGQLPRQDRPVKAANTVAMHDQLRNAGCREPGVSIGVFE
jgi:hypothetical protein